MYESSPQEKRAEGEVIHFVLYLHPNMSVSQSRRIDSAMNEIGIESRPLCPLIAC